MLKRSLAGLVFLLACGGDSADPTTQLPATPGTALTSARTGEIVLNWLDVPNETHYRIEYRRDGEASWLLLLETPANTTTVTHGNVTRNVQYFYRIAACNASGCSGWAEAGGKWISTGGPPTLLTTDVTGIGGNVATLSATARAGGGPVTFRFTLVKAGETTPFYTSEPVFVEPSYAMDPDGIATGFMVTNLLQPDTEYSLYVSAVNDYGQSAPMGGKSFRTRVLGPPAFSRQSNATSASGARSFSITVHPNGFDTEYRFELARAGESFATPLATETAYAHAANQEWPAFTISMPLLAQPGVAYKWRVVAQNSAGAAVSDSLPFTR